VSPVRCHSVSSTKPNSAPLRRGHAPTAAATAFTPRVGTVPESSVPLDQLPWGLEPMLTQRTDDRGCRSADRNSGTPSILSARLVLLSFATFFEQRCAKCFHACRRPLLGTPFGGPQWDREESRRGFAGPLGCRRLAKMSKKIRVIPFWTDHLARLLIAEPRSSAVLGEASLPQSTNACCVAKPDRRSRPRRRLSYGRFLNTARLIVTYSMCHLFHRLQRMSAPNPQTRHVSYRSAARGCRRPSGT
jgi:hypothetical protein